MNRLAWIEHIGVHPNSRRRGVGLALLRAVAEHYNGNADAVYAEIHPLNEPFKQFFRKWQDGAYEQVCIYKTLEREKDVN